MFKFWLGIIHDLEQTASASSLGDQNHLGLLVLVFVWRFQHIGNAVADHSVNQMFRREKDGFALVALPFCFCHCEIKLR
jgi:hypothetical protein